MGAIFEQGWERGVVEMEDKESRYVSSPAALSPVSFRPIEELMTYHYSDSRSSEFDDDEGSLYISASHDLSCPLDQHNEYYLTFEANARRFGM